MKKPIVMGILFFALFIAYASAQPPIQPSIQQLNIQIPSDPVTLDPTLAEDGLGLRILNALYRGAMTYDSKNHLQPALAEKIQPLKTGYRIVLKKDLKWSDGTPLTTQDFYFSLKRALNPDTQSKFSFLLYCIENAEEYQKKKITDFSQVGILVKSPVEMEFKLIHSQGVFPHLLTLSIFLPQKEKLDFSITNGPYTLTEYKRNQHMKLKKNKFFNFTKKTAPEEVTFHIISDENTGWALFKNKKLDILLRPPYLHLEEAKKQNTLQKFPYFAIYYLGFNHRNALGKDLSLRKAISSFIDKKSILELIENDGQIAKQWLPPYLGIELSSSDPGKKESLQVLTPPQKAVLSFDVSHRNQLIAEKIQGDLKNHGVFLDLEKKEWKTYISLLTTHPPDLFRFGWLSPLLDPFGYLMIFTSTNPNNYTGWKNNRYDALIGLIRDTPSSQKRNQLIQEAQNILHQEAVIIPIFHYFQTIAVSPQIKNIKMNGLGFLDYNELEVSPEEK